MFCQRFMWLPGGALSSHGYSWLWGPHSYWIGCKCESYHSVLHPLSVLPEIIPDIEMVPSFIFKKKKKTKFTKQAIKWKPGSQQYSTRQTLPKVREAQRNLHHSKANNRNQTEYKPVPKPLAYGKLTSHNNTSKAPPSASFQLPPVLHPSCQPSFTASVPRMVYF